MKSVSVAALKSNLSSYLKAVQKGQEIIVTSHKQPIARVAPLEDPNDDIVILPAKKPISFLKKIRGTPLPFDPVELLLEDRRRR